MSERIIKTGLGPRYKDMLDAVIGQMSDGYWENTPMMRGYWKFVTTGTSGNEVTLNVDETSGARDGDRRIENRFYGMSDDAVKKFFADKIKFLIKEEGLGKWDRSNEETTDYLSYKDPYRVKDCYYAYEVLKGRIARKHAEYGDVEESRQPVKIKLVEKAKNAVEELFAKWIEEGAAGMALTSDGKGIICHDQFGTSVRYAAGVLTFSFDKDDVEESLLDLELVISKHTAFHISVSDNKVKITAAIQPDEAVKLLNEFFDAE